MKSLILSLVCLLSANLFAGTYKAEFFLSGKKELRMKAGEPKVIEILIKDQETDKAVLDYKPMHGKLMHFVIIRKDLGVFKHVHPYLEPISGRFALPINIPLSDPDNQNVADALSEPGEYHLVAEIVTKEKGMRMFMTSLVVEGEHQHNHLSADPLLPNGKIYKEFSHSEFPFLKSEEAYSAELFIEQIPGCNGSIVKFNLELTHLDGVDRTPVTVEPWLGAGAHGVWLSAGDHHEMMMPMGHGHASMPPFAEFPLELNFFDRGQFRHGLQRIWIQVRHQGRVLTLPFTFKYMPKSLNCES